MENESSTALIGTVYAIVIVGTAVCVVIGIKTAIRKNRSPHWMWFGIYPIGALVMMIVFLCLDPLKTCPMCLRKSKVFARVCPYCNYNFSADEAARKPGTLGI